MITDVKVSRKAFLSGHNGPVYALETGNQPGTVYSGSSDRIIAQWNLEKPGDGSQIAKSTEIIYALLNVELSPVSGFLSCQIRKK